jgi:hypothetical protein
MFMMASKKKKKIGWTKGVVVSLRVKGDLWVLAQMLISPYLLFFNRFERGETPTWSSPPTHDEVLFPAAVTRQFLQLTDIQRERLPGIEYEAPTAWIKQHPGSRHVTVWPGTDHERTVLLLSDRPGGSLRSQRIDDKVGTPQPTLIKDIPLDDDATIDGHELAGVWTAPLLNERLYLCHVLERNVDPHKDLTFDRSLPDEYRTFVDIAAMHGSADDWGYGDFLR